MNKNLKKYKKALDNISVDDELKEKTLKKLRSLDDKNSSKYTLYKRVTYSLATVLAGALLIFPMFLYNGQSERTAQVEDISDVLTIEEKDILPKVGTVENLESLLNLRDSNEDYLSSSNEEFISEDSSKSQVLADYSETNIQVEGVDEADIVKTNGDYIYYIANSKLYVVNAKNPNSIKVENT